MRQTQWTVKPAAGTLDTFTDLTTMGWGGDPAAVTIKSSGGPAGAGDAHLRVTATGGAGPGTRLATDNGDARWIGNYQTAGITGVEADFINFGFINGDSVAVWKRSIGTVNPINLKRDIAAISGDSSGAGLAYALISSRCCRCGRKLTVPASIHNGMGPECASKEN